jgi:hypothetical protein
MNMPHSQPLPAFKPTKLSWIGLVFLAVSSGPLLLTMLFASLGLPRDPNPNPIGSCLLPPTYSAGSTRQRSLVGIISTLADGLNGSCRAGSRSSFYG